MANSAHFKAIRAKCDSFTRILTVGVVGSAAWHGSCSQDEKRGDDVNCLLHRQSPFLPLERKFNLNRRLSPGTFVQHLVQSSLHVDRVPQHDGIGDTSRNGTQRETERNVR